MPYVGHLITAEGLKIDPQKVKAVDEMPEPKTKEDVKRLLDFVQSLNRYLPGLSKVDAPLRGAREIRCILPLGPSTDRELQEYQTACVISSSATML